MSGLRRSFSKFLDAAEVPALISKFRDYGYQGLQLKGAQYGHLVAEPRRALDELGTDPGIYSAVITGDSIDTEPAFVPPSTSLRPWAPSESCSATATRTKASTGNCVGSSLDPSRR
jgi:hypothetical protein